MGTIPVPHNRYYGAQTARSLIHFNIGDDVKPAVLIKALGQHKTVLFSSHILQEVEAICSRVLIIHKGNLVANQSIHELNQSNRLEVIFRSLTGAISV